jgi:uncharacterized SAM-binding protein YcdF (DUF218 family)
VIRALALLLAAWLGAASYLFLWPHDDDELPPRADAVVVLSGSKERLPVGLRLVREGVAPVLVLSAGEEAEEIDPRIGRLCSGSSGLTPRRPLCFRADPSSTRGEARQMARLARRFGWDELVVVTSGFHVFRARRVLERCYRGRVWLADAPVDWWWLPWAMATESVKLVLAETIWRACRS